MSEELKPGERELLKYLAEQPEGLAAMGPILGGVCKAEQPPASAGTPDFGTLNRAISDLGELEEMLLEKQESTGFDGSIALRLKQVAQTLKSIEPVAASQTAGPSGEAGARARFIDPAKCDHELTRCDTFATCEICGIETYTPPYLTAHQKDLAACQKGETKPQAGPAAFTSISGEPK